ncbi:ribonuclease R [Fastidiosipila sanguinis]|uniref:Ribonuclease R n=2 Tax=Fastidiosipila sanguinis TaxID=236753 RepID=A0A2S0KNT2_9FIRM|nr:ribonuclease R [Fastidiosipila sanguinis]
MEGLMQKIIGILEQDGRDGLVSPDGKLVSINALRIPEPYLNGAPFGMKVVVELISSPDSPDPLGKVVEVLGDPARPDVAMEAIMLMHGLSETFPAEVEAELEFIPYELSEEALEEALKIGRKDLRDLVTITIDGIDARDLDDAISIQKDQDGSYRLYVHIADVAEYVKEGSALDKEALNRGNSVYLADRVIPMLPPKLSNGICSLNPNTPRLAMTCMLQYDSGGTLIDGDIYESVITSDLRADYDTVKIALEEQPIPSYEKYMREFHWMQELAEILESKSQSRGALEFDFPETAIDVDKDGKVLDIYPESNSFVNEIIEQFMVAANSFVAEKFTELEMPFIYRVHDNPDEEKLLRFREVLKMVGDRDVKIPKDPRPKDIKKILNKIRDLPAAKTLETLLLRSLAKASYSDEPIGHFGLALEDYSHFTAPIRRYSDVFIHRVIKGFLRADMNIKKWKAEAPDVAEHVSDTERIAVLAERASTDQKVAEYYADRLGEVYEAEITGFVGAGMFVMLPSTAEGMIPFRTMDDFYVYDERTMTAQGRDKHRLFMMGDKVKVRIARADVVRRHIDLVLVDENSSGRIDRSLSDKKAKRKEVEKNRHNRNSSSNKKRKNRSRNRYNKNSKSNDLNSESNSNRSKRSKRNNRKRNRRNNKGKNRRA